MAEIPIVGKSGNRASRAGASRLSKPSANGKHIDIEQLTKEVKKRLGNRVKELRINETDEGLVLTGWTATYHAKQLVQHAVMELSDKPISENKIEVR